MTRFLMFATAVAVALPVAQPARAESVAVHYGDLDLSSPPGRTALNRRIAAAARSVCGVGGTRELRAAMEAQNCFRDAIKSTRTQMAAVAPQELRGTM